MMCIRKRRILALIFPLSLIAGCSGGSESQPASSNASASLESRIATQLTLDTGEAWLCGVGNTVLAAYLFIPAGQVDGVNPAHRLGLEIDHSKPSMAEQVRYLWSTQSDSQLVMESPDRTESVIWSGIEFVDANYMQLSSSNRGLMDCYRGVGRLPQDV